MEPVRPSLIEFPADDPERALRFWSGVLGAELAPRDADQGEGWQSGPGPGPGSGSGSGVRVGVHSRGRGPGDSFSLPYFSVDDMAAAVARVTELGGSVVHPGERWAICRDSEGSPFGLAAGGAV
jgi:predicted enzyme related to lactoylglutathione lyase